METRTTKELLELMLENHHLIGKHGLCRINNMLETTGLINGEEHQRIAVYIYTHKPRKRHDVFYFWMPGDREPRIKWLKKHIKLNSENENKAKEY